MKLMVQLDAAEEALSTMMALRGDAAGGAVDHLVKKGFLERAGPGPLLLPTRDVLVLHT